MPKKQKKTKKIPKPKSVGNVGKTENAPEVDLGVKERAMLKEKDQIEQLMLQGFTQAQIAPMLGMNLRTLERRVQGIREQNLSDDKAFDELQKKHLGLEYLKRFRYAANQAWITKSNTKSDKDKLRAIEISMAAWDREIKILQTLGYIAKDPEVGDEATPMTVIFKGMPRPDRTKQLKELKE